MPELADVDPPAVELAVGAVAGAVGGPVVGLVVRPVVGPVVGRGARPVVGAPIGAAVLQEHAKSAQAASAAAHRPRRSRVVMVAMMRRPGEAGPRPGVITKSYRLGNDLPRSDISAHLAASDVS